MKDSSFLIIICFVLALLLIVIIWNYLVFPLSIIEKMIGLPLDEVFVPLDEILKQGRIADIESLKYELFRDFLMALTALLAVGIPGIYLLLRRVLETELEDYKQKISNLLHCQNSMTFCTQQEKDKEKEILELLHELKKIETRKIIPLWLDSLINKARTALQHAEGSKNKRAELLAKNNLAYYLAIAKSSEEEARKLIAELYKFRYKYHHTDWYHWHDTLVWVNWRFAKTKEEKEKARETFNELYKQKEKIPDRGFKQKLKTHKKFFR